MRSFHVEHLISEAGKRLGLELMVGSGGVTRNISSVKIQRPGKRLYSESSRLRANRVIVLGKTELDGLKGLPTSHKRAIYREIALLPVPCIIVEGSFSPPEDLRSFAQEQAIPLLCTDCSGANLTKILQSVLEKLLGSEFNIQGVLMRVFGVGVLILGKSGIGKSECALDLITRGHALVADDMVELKRGSSGEVVGTSPELIRHHMEVRGLGIINILELFGPDAVADESSLDVVVELLEWQRFLFMDRTGLTQMIFTILETDLPLFRIPVSLNRNLAIILEVAVRNHLLQQKGICTIERLEQQIESQLRTKASS